MKRLLILIAALTISVGSYAQVTLTRVWERSQANGSTMPAWFGSATERGIAYGHVGSNDRVFVTSRSTTTAVRILSAADGSDVSTLSLTGVSGGTYAISDVGVSADGIIFVCNMTTDASTTQFKVYRWDSEGVDPTNVISYTGTGRMGDKMTVAGSTSDNSLVIYAAVASTTTLIKFTTSDNGGSFTPNTITLAGATTNAQPSITPLPNGTFYYKAAGSKISKHNSDGSSIDAGNASSTYATGHTGLAFINTVSSDDYLFVCDRTTSGYGFASVYKMAGGIPSAGITAVSTSAMGTSSTTGYADIDLKNNGDDTFTIFMVSANEGVAAYVTGGTPALPVELSSFTAQAIGSAVSLNWVTTTEANNFGFDIERRGIGDSPWMKVGFVKGNGTSTMPHTYSYTDVSVTSGTFIYRLKQIDNGGMSKYSQSAEVALSVPRQCELSQNFPNPFNPSSTLSVSLALPQYVKLAVYNSIGQEVARLADENLAAGTYRFTFDATNLPSGIYFARIQTQEYSKIVKMTLMK